MRDFCAEEGIPFLDLTGALQARVAEGHNVYFPDDSHWNAAGHEVAARALSDFLRERPYVQGAARLASFPARRAREPWRRE
jgi:lysophospholipase L1-like esterase